MDYTKIAIAVLTAATTVLSLCGVITADDSAHLATTGAAAATGLGGFIGVIIDGIKTVFGWLTEIVRKRKAEKES